MFINMFVCTCSMLLCTLYNNNNNNNNNYYYYYYNYYYCDWVKHNWLSGSS